MFEKCGSSFDACGDVPLFEPSANAVRNFCRAQPAESAFPHNCHSPTMFAQRNLIALVTGDIFLKFPKPKFWSRRWRGCVFATHMAVPKTALNQDGGAPLRKHDVRRAGQSPIVQAEAEATGMECAPKGNLRAGMLTPDARHHPRAGRGINDIDHRISPGTALQTWYGLWR